MTYDVLIVGGGPTGLSAALALGRARKRVLLSDAGPRRNALATHLQNFVTRDGTPPDEFRAIGTEQLRKYPNVEVRSERIESITGERNAFRVTTSSGTVQARRVLLCTGMIDEMMPIDGFRELWGHGIFQCPYCHGWEVQDQKWGFVVRTVETAHLTMFALMLRGWSADVTVFANGINVPADAQARLGEADIRVEAAPVKRLAQKNGRMMAVELEDGTSVPRDVLFAHPAQRQVELVSTLGVALDDEGYVRVEPMMQATSVPGIYASGDATTRGQGAVLGAAGGTRAAAALNVDLATDPLTIAAYAR